MPAQPLLRKPAVQGVLITLGFMLLLIIAASLSSTEEPKAQPKTAIVVASTIDGLSTSIMPNAPQYDEVKAFLSDYPQNELGAYFLTSTAYQEMVNTFASSIRARDRLNARVKDRLNANATVTAGTSPPVLTTHTPDEQRARWKEQWTHWENIDAFKESAKSISADRIIDKEESKRICFVKEQWTTQMAAAKTYVVEYRKFDPIRAALPSIYKIEEEANRILELLSQADCQ